VSLPTIVVDASVAIKWVVPEPDSSDAELLLDTHRLIAPQLIYAECGNILWKLVRRGQLSFEQALLATTLVDDFAVQTVSMRELVPSAVDLSVRLDHPAYDCFYAALAILQECAFVTADSKLCIKARLGLKPHEAARFVMLGSLARR
jgi:predicted nucleic acid-binding protein